MSSPVIKVEHLGKVYRIGGKKKQYRTLRDTLRDTLTAPFHRAGNLLRGIHTGAAEFHETIWALHDVSFEVQPGEIIGIIGRNGAGKSTLLKVLSRITEPTEGYAEICGRLGSLLEVGTGFHHELTGRENVYLNGAILGMKRTEINGKFDEIVEFSGVEKFIDTPVKHYSSGMYLRLAFAVAAHLEPDVLLVDEVLAVGDAVFQRKCLDKMQDVGREGRTVLFVSHNIPAITRLCARTIMLDGGSVTADGPSYEVVSRYLTSDLGTSAEREWPEVESAPGYNAVRMCRIRIKTEDGKATEVVSIRQPVGIEIEFEVLEQDSVLWPYVTLHNQEGLCLFLSIDQDPDWRGRPRLAGRFVSTCWVPANLLAVGSITVDVAIRAGHPFMRQFDEKQVVAFQVVEALENDPTQSWQPARFPGVIRPQLTWTTSYTPLTNKKPCHVAGTRR